MTNEAQKVILQHLATRSLAERLTQSMGIPLAHRVSYQMLPVFREGAGGDIEVSTEPVSLALPWDQIQEGQPRFERMSRLQDRAVDALKADFGGQMVSALQDGPVTRFTEDRLREAAATLTVETEEGQTFRPVVLLASRAYWDLRSQGMFGQDPECQRWALGCGHIDNFDQCVISSSRNMAEDDVWVVSRDPSVSRSPVKMSATLTAYGEADGEFRVDFEASFFRTAWPTVVRFRLGR